MTCYRSKRMCAKKCQQKMLAVLSKFSSICYPELGYSRNETGFFSKANKNISLYLTAETEHWSKILTFCSYLWTLLAEIGIGCLSVSQTFW